MNVVSLEMNGTSDAFICSGHYDPSRQPKPLLQSSGVSLLNDQNEKWNTLGARKLASHGRGQTGTETSALQSVSV